MRKALIWSAALLILLGAGTAALFFALRPAAPPWDLLAARYVRAVDEEDDAALRQCLLAAVIRPEDRTAYGFSNAEPTVPEAEQLRQSYETQLKDVLSARRVHEMLSSSITHGESPEKTVTALRSLELAGCSAQRDPEGDHAYLFTLYVRMIWTDGEGTDRAEVMVFDSLRAVEYRDNWYLTGV